MDSGSDNDSAGDGRSADERRDRKNLRQIAKRRRAEKELRKREKALGGKREPRRLRRGRKKVAALTAPDEAQKTDKPRMRKLRFAFVILGLGLLAFVSWIFGIMMAVAQDLPSLENRQQYLEAENSVVYDAYNNKLATLTNNQGRILLDSDGDRPGDEGGRGRDRGPALLRAQRRRLPGHRPRRLAGRVTRARRSRAPRRSPSSSSRTRSPPRTAGPCSRSCARRRSPTTSSANGPRTRSSPST